MKIYRLIQYFIATGICIVSLNNIYGMSYQQKDKSYVSFDQKSQISLDISLYKAIKNQDYPEISTILEKKADLEGTNVKNLFKNLTPLDVAVLIEDMTIIQLLIDNGADVDYKNKQGQTALDLASDKYALCLRDLTDAKFNPSFFTLCCQQTIINKLEEQLEKLKVIINYLNNYTEEPLSKEHAQSVLLLTLDDINSYQTLTNQV